MWIKFLLVISLTLLILGGCTEEDNPIISSDDVTPPNDIVDLVAVNPTSSTVTLNFIAAGDDDDIGRGKIFDIRYSTSLITEANFSSAIRFDTNLIPNVGQNLDTIVVTNLSPSTTYYFAVKTGDEVPNWSGISNIDSATTLVSGGWQVHNTSNSDLPSDTVLDVTTYLGNKYFATTDGLGVLSQIGWTIYDTTTIIQVINNDTTSLLTSNNYNNVDVDPNGSIWIGIVNSGAAVITDSVVAHYDTDNSDLFTNSITDIIATAADNIYISTANAGFYQYDLTNWHEYTVDSGLVNNSINTIAVDSSGNVWIAYNIGGISKFDGVSFTHYNTTGVWAIEVLSNGNLLLSTDDGLILYDGINFSNITPDIIGFPGNYITALTAFNDVWWIGTSNGLARYDGVNWTIFTSSNSLLPGNFINALAVDQTGNLIVGTNSGGAVYIQ